MSTITTATRTLAPWDETTQIAQVQAALQQLITDPAALMLARLQHLLNLSAQDPQVRQCLYDAVTHMNQQARELGHEVIA